MNPIKRVRTQVLKVTQVDFAAAIGSTQPIVSELEKENRDNRMSTLVRILAAYPSLDPAEFFKTDDGDAEDLEKVVLEQDVEAGGELGPIGETPNREALAADAH